MNVDAPADQQHCAAVYAIGLWLRA